MTKEQKDKQIEARKRWLEKQTSEEKRRIKSKIKRICKK